MKKIIYLFIFLVSLLFFSCNLTNLKEVEKENKIQKQKREFLEKMDAEISSKLNKVLENEGRALWDFCDQNSISMQADELFPKINELLVQYVNAGIVQFKIYLKEIKDSSFFSDEEIENIFNGKLKLINNTFVGYRARIVLIFSQRNDLDTSNRQKFEKFLDETIENCKKNWAESLESIK